LTNKLGVLKWELHDVPLSLLVNPKKDLRYVRSPSFKVRLRSSLSSLGILEPLKVRARGDFYEILDGVTRKEDLQELGYSGSVPCLVTSCTDEEALTLQCVFAFTRKLLDPIGFAHYVKLKKSQGLTLSQIGEPFHLKKSQVSKYLALNKLTPEEKVRVANRELSVDQAYALVTKKRELPLSKSQVETKPCPWCGERIESPWLTKTELCPSCQDLLRKSIARARKFKQRQFPF